VSSSVSATLYRRLVLNPPLIPSHSRSCVISVLTSPCDINEFMAALEVSIASKMNISQDVAWFAVRKRAHGDHVMIQRARPSAIRAGISRCAHPGLFSGPADASHTLRNATHSCLLMTLCALRVLASKDVTAFARSLRALKHSSRLPVVHHRRIGWLNPLSWRPIGGEPGLPGASTSACEAEQRDEEAKSAILEKLMQGRQPTDLMLRCM
jgi:hypothetical protein